MTNYSLWEVIINGDSPKPLVIEGSTTPIVILTAEQKLARRNELNARGTLLMSLPDKHQLKFNSHKDAKTLMEAIEKRSEDLDQIHDRLQKLVSQHDIHEVSMSQEDINLKKFNIKIAFVSSSNTDSTTDSVSAATSVSAVCAQLPISSHPKIDSLSNAIIFSFFSSQSTSPQLDNKDLKQIDVDDLKEIDLRWQMAMLTMRARHFLQKTGRNLVETSTSNALVSQCDGIGSYEWSYQDMEEPANFALMAISSSNSSDNEFEKFQSSSKNLAELIASQTNNKHGLGYLPSEDVSANLSLSCPSNRVQPSGGYNTVPPPITGNFMPPKPDLVFNTAPLVVEFDHSAFNVQVSTAKPAQVMSHTTESMAPIIEDWVSDSEDESEPNDPKSAPSFVQPSEQVKTCGHSAQPVEAPILDHTPKPTSSNTNVFTKSKPVSVTAARPVSAADPKIMAAKPRHAHSLHTKNNSIIRRHQTPSKFSKTSNSSPKVTAAHAKVVSVAKGKKGK
nr:ribonuclease H-like domain-containing protein [Tanacetum cinerariifolium]